MDNRFTILTETEEKEIVSRFKNGCSVVPLIKTFHIGPKRLYEILEAAGLPRRPAHGPRRYSLQEDAFSAIDSPAKAYWLGFLAADGCVSKTKHRNVVSLGLNPTDSAHVEKFLHFLGSDQPIEFCNKKISPYCRVTVSSAKLVADLGRHGIVPRKSLILTFSGNLDPAFYNHYIRGYFDGDGCIIAKRRKDNDWAHTYFSIAGTKSFLGRVAEVLSKNTGVSVSMRSYKSIHILEISARKKIEGVMEWLYVDSDEATRLDRKYERYQKLLSL